MWYFYIGPLLGCQVCCVKILCNPVLPRGRMLAPFTEKEAMFRLNYTLKKQNSQELKLARPVTES